MQKNDNRLVIGFEVSSGKKTDIPVWHMLIAGTTQLSGKTTLLKTLANQAVEKGYKVLVFDTKENFADYEGFGTEIPICLRETTDSLTILALLESIMKRKLTPQYATLSLVSENAKNFSDVLENTEKLIEKSRGFTQNAARVLRDLMRRLIEETKGRKTTPELQLPNQINRMTINNFTLEGQQMVIKTALEDAIHFKKLIVIIDEMSKFMPQRYHSACHLAINHFVTQGAITEDFLWGSTQFLATTSKDVMKAMDVKVLGRQSHDTECEHTLDLVPAVDNLKLTKDHVMKLKVGHFIAIAENWVKIVYTCPDNAVEAQCIEVAKGNREPSDLQYAIPLSEEAIENFPVMEVVDIEPEYEIIEIETEEDVEESKTEPKEEVKSEQTKLTGGFKSSRLDNRFELIENNIEALRQMLKDIEKRKGNPKEVEELKKRIKLLEGKGVTASTELTNVKHVISVKDAVRYKTATNSTLRGKILLLAKDKFFGEWRSLSDVEKEFESKPWTVNSNQIKNQLNRLVKEAILATKQENKEYLYKLTPNVIFESPEEKSDDES